MIPSAASSVISLAVGPMLALCLFCLLTAAMPAAKLALLETLMGSAL